MAEDESAQKKADELLRTGRLVFLQTAGFTAARIVGFGDLTKLPNEKMSELLHNRMENAIANMLGESLQKKHLRVKTTGSKKRRKR